MAKELPILICTDLIPAIMDGRKTVTRRVIIPQPDFDASLALKPILWKRETGGEIAELFNDNRWAYDGNSSCKIYKARYKKGDLLWVRENWWDLGRMENGKWDGRLESHTVKPRYVATCPDPYAEGIGGIIQPIRIPWRQCSGPMISTWRKRPSIHMFKWIARTWLEVLDVRPERLQEISDQDCIAEGIELHGKSANGRDDVYVVYLANTNHLNKPCDGPGYYYRTGGPKVCFQMLWDSLNAKRGYSWESNPWVWRYEFKKTILSISVKR